MLIKEMFSKPINRDIKGVVKVGQDDADIIKQELEEYVVTKELQRHFRDFFSSYKRGINGNTDKVGVWISGFFGSGKSHFLKMLSYLLENRVVDGKHAIEYFLEDEKIKDPMVVADMQLAASVPTDSILFNIDSKSETAGKQDKDSIINVFLKVFNENCGYSTNPHVADLERLLEDEGLYEDFKDKYKELSKEDWISARHKFNFFKDRVVKTLVEIDFMTMDTAREWSSSTVEEYKMSIQDFAIRINNYLENKGRNHQIVFLVDEVGQYIGADSELMLNIQTITEDLGRYCQGKAWVVVTSQQDIDSISQVKGNDFSKIQGRFDTRISLTSANVDEVIKLRILEKTETANQTLSVLYENKETIIKNLIIFNDEIEKKLYEDKEDFSEVYPFIPYQFNILASVLTSIRKHGASGKHLSEGERSMLALFKESAEKLMNHEVGTIVPFNIFYGALNKFLDHSHSVVVSRALDSNIINPEGEEDNFNVNVLKTLFMIKYVKEIHPNIENITTLMVSHIDEDRIKLREKVEEALDMLVKQMLVQKNGDFYIFLTDEEQEINREIESQEIESADVTRKLSELIFADIYHNDKLKIPGFNNKYAFPFNRLVDDVPYRSSRTFDFGVSVITPYSSLNGQNDSLRMISQKENNVYVDLPGDIEFLQELRLSMKIEKFLNSSTSGNIPKFEEIRLIKRREMDEYDKRARLFLQEALKQATLYVNGDVLRTSSNDFASNLNEGLERLVSTVYHKLNYINQTMDESDIYSLFKKESQTQLKLDDVSTPNENAIRDIVEYIVLRTKSYTKISLKEIKDRFSKAPYGFLDTDIEWLVAKCFKDGTISLSLSGDEISLLNERPEKIVDYITKRSYVEKLLIEEKEIIPEHMKRSMKIVSKDLFESTISTEDTDAMVYQFNKSAAYMVGNLEKKLSEYKTGKYPGESIISEGVKLVQKTLEMNKAKEIFEYVNKKEDDYLDFAEDYPEIKAFLEGEQKSIWERAQKYIKIFEDSKSYIFDKDIEKNVEEMESIIRMTNPYNNIARLPKLNEDFMITYNELLDEELKPVKVLIEDARTRVTKSLEENNLEETFTSKFNQSFNELINKAESCNNIAQINGFRIEADTLKIRFLDEISKEVERIRKEKADEGEKGEEPVEPAKKYRNISIKSINTSSTWKIETKEDLEDYITILKNNLEKQLEENTILNIEF